MHNKVKGPDLDVAKLVRRFNGATELQRRITKAGYTVNLKTIQMWIHRARIPADWLPVLLVLAEQEGRPLRLDQYVKAQKKPKAKAKAATTRDAGFLE